MTTRQSIGRYPYEFHLAGKNLSAGFDESNNIAYQRRVLQLGFRLAL